jgi:ribosomal protein S18 acetylase RimI-like enzyme
VTLTLPDWLDRAMPELVQDYLDPPPAARAKHLRNALTRCAAGGDVLSIRRNGTVDAVAGVEPLDWDSRHFGFGCGRLAPLCLAPDLDASARLAAVADVADWALGWCRKSGVDMLMRRMIGARAGEAASFEERGFRLVDSIVTMTAKADAQVPHLPVRTAIASDRDALLAIAREAFPHSRFVADGSLNPDKARAVYVHWLEMLLSGGTAGGKSGSDGVVLVCEWEGRVAGFSAIRRDKRLEELARRIITPMEMFAVAEFARGNGLGAALLAATRDWSAHQGADLVEASTWTASTAARRSYWRAGFSIRDTLLTFHGRVQ